MNKIKNTFIFKLLFGFIIIFSNMNCYGLSVDGYIINLNYDTIYGQIQLSKFDRQTGNYIINGIDENSLKYMVGFKPKENKKFKPYFTEMLLGYGFTYNSTKFIYQRKELVTQNSKKSKNKRYLFVRI